jgi:hypothetical protein
MNHPPVTPVTSLIVRLFLAIAIFTAPALFAQLAGTGTIQGTITDPSGAIIPGAEIKVVQASTNVEHDQKSTAAGLYSVAGLEPGLYTLTVTAPGFQTFVQQNVKLDALQVFGVNIKLTVGATDTIINVNTAPPPLETTNATLGTTMENETYEALPLNMGGAPRDPTAFVYLTPGVVSDGHYGQFNGGQSYNNETYIEGLAITDPAVQGNTQGVNRGVSVDAVDQFQVQTSGSSAQYQGQGFSNYTLKSGSNQFHGRAFEYFRNTVLDTWGYTSKNAINPVTHTAIKPVERQNEYGGTLGGPILRNKAFFFASYDAQQYLKGSNPSLVTVPTLLNRAGDFSDNAPIYDPTTTAPCANGVGTCRQQFSYNGKLNVIAPSRFSNVAKFYQNFIPVPTDNTTTVNNYLGGFNTGFTYAKYSIKFDYDISSKNRATLLFTYGNRAAKPACCDSSGLPVPFTATVGNSQFNFLGVLEDTYTITDHWINQLKYGVSRGGGVSLNPGEGPQYAASASGLLNLPTGQAADAAPRFGFGGGLVVPASLGGTSNSNNQGNSEYGTGYILSESMQYVHGKHSMSWGGQYQWLDDNDTSLTGGTYLNLNFSNNETATFTTNTSTLNTATGSSYAAFLIGAIDNGSITDARQVITTGARYYTFSPFFQDDYKATQRLTLNLGLRWDDYSPFHEVNNKLSFVDLALTNPVTGTRGALNFAGTGTGTCNCTTPVVNWYKNFGPHLGFAYSATPKTVIRGGYDIAYTHAGGVGGRGGGRQGTGQLGFSGGASIATVDGGITPGLYLSPSAGYSLPSYAQPTQTPAFGTGYTTTPGYTGSPQGVSYADPYLSRRAPYYENFNLGVQREVLKQTVLNVNYSGSTGHFLGTGIGHGIYSNQLDPQYYPLGSLLTSAATPANVLKAQAILPSFKLPYANFSPSASIGQALRPFAQYNSFSDVWGDFGTSNYNSLQISLTQKPTHGISFAVNYTYSKLYDDTGTGRTAYGNNAYSERALSTTDLPSNVSAYGVWEERFGRGGGNRFVNTLIKDFVVSGIYRYTSGYPLAITASGCNTPFGGTCMPNLNPNLSGQARINGGYGANTQAVAFSTPYVNYNAFSVPGAYAIGNAPRTYAYGLRAPGGDDTDMSLRRVFSLYERLRFTFQADVFNLTNNVRFSAPNTTYTQEPLISGTTTPDQTKQTFGKITGVANGSRDIQFSGKIDF